jgi:hypothetical protein
MMPKGPHCDAETVRLQIGISVCSGRTPQTTAAAGLGVGGAAPAGRDADAAMGGMIATRRGSVSATRNGSAPDAALL